MKYPPTVYIGGQELICEFLPTGNAVVMDDVEITWGRDSLYAPTNPSDIRLTLLDPTGAYGSNPGLYGSELILQTSLGILFKGRIDGIRMTPDVIRGDDSPTPPDGGWPAPPEDRNVWRVEITASDVIATLAKLILPGPGPLPTMIPADTIQVYGQGMWPYNDSNARRAAIENAIRGAGIPLDIEQRNLGEAAPAGKNWSLWYKEPSISAGDDMYTMVQRVQARGDEFFTANYLPYRDVLGINRWAASASLELYYANSIINVRSGTGAANVVDCSLVGLDDESVSAAVDHNVTVIEMAEYTPSIRTVQQAGGTTGQVVVWSSANQVTGVSSPGGGVARYVSPAQLAVNTTTFGDPNTATSEKASDFGPRLAAIAQQVNGKLIPPDLVFDIENENFPADIVAQLLATWTTPDTQPKAWVFPGNRYEELTGFGPFFQLIGGALRFRQGWEVTGRFAPSRATTAELTISQLVTTDPPQFDQYAPSISLATLGTVAKGI